MLTKIEMDRQILVKLPTLIFNENLFSSRVVTYRQTNTETYLTTSANLHDFCIKIGILNFPNKKQECQPLHSDVIGRFYCYANHRV
jgi:hypothetical protein